MSTEANKRSISHTRAHTAKFYLKSLRWPPPGSEMEATLQETEPPTQEMGAPEPQLPSFAFAGTALTRIAMLMPASEPCSACTSTMWPFPCTVLLAVGSRRTRACLRGLVLVLVWTGTRRGGGGGRPECGASSDSPFLCTNASSTILSCCSRTVLSTGMFATSPFSTSVCAMLWLNQEACPRDNVGNVGGEVNRLRDRGHLYPRWQSELTERPETLAGRRARVQRRENGNREAGGG